MSGPLFDENNDIVSNKIDYQLIKESEIFGLNFFGDDATMLCTLFINTLVSGVHDETGLLEIDNYIGHVAKGFKKDAECITKLFIPRMERMDPEKLVVLIFIFTRQHLMSPH